MNGYACTLSTQSSTNYCNIYILYNNMECHILQYVTVLSNACRQMYTDILIIIHILNLNDFSYSYANIANIFPSS